MLRLGQLVSQTELGRDVALPQPTVHRYLNLLETSYLLVRLPAYAVNRTKRLAKAPELHWEDTGLALHPGGATDPAGAHLENLVLGDLLTWRDARLERAEVFYWRTSLGEEVDFVIEAAGPPNSVSRVACAAGSAGGEPHIKASTSIPEGPS